MPKGIFNWVVNQVVHLMNRIAAFYTDRIVAYTQDYAEHSPYLSSYTDKLEVINPPVIVPEISTETIKRYRQEHNPDDNHPVIGMAARFATEKGVEVLLNASEEILRDYPKAEFWFAGPYENIMGEQHYFERLRPKIEALQQAGIGSSWDCFLRKSWRLFIPTWIY